VIPDDLFEKYGIKTFTYTLEEIVDLGVLDQSTGKLSIEG